MLLLLLSICLGVKKAQNSIVESFFVEKAIFRLRGHWRKEEQGSKIIPLRGGGEKVGRAFFDKLSCSFFSSVRSAHARSSLRAPQSPSEWPHLPCSFNGIYPPSAAVGREGPDEEEEI